MAYQLGPIAITGTVLDLTGSFNISGSLTQNSAEVVPYKVFVCNMTQSGSDSLQVLIFKTQSSLLQLGVTQQLAATN